MNSETSHNNRPESRTWDEADLLTQLMGNRTAAMRIAALFVKTTTKDLALLRSSVTNLEWDSAARIAHSIKGAAGNFRAWALHETAIAFEDACRSRSAPDAQTRLRQLDAEFIQLQDVLNSKGIEVGG